MRPAFRTLSICPAQKKNVVKTGAFRNPDNVAESRKDSYHVSLLTLIRLNLGHVNRKPCIGGGVKFPSWIRNDANCVVLPNLVFRKGAHIVALYEANDPTGGIARHQHLAHDHAMPGMVVHAEITATSVAAFARGAHEVGPLY